MMPEFPPFRLDTVNQCLWRRTDEAQDERILLTPKAFGILSHLVDHAGQLVTHRELLDAVWPQTAIEPQALKRTIFELRRALDDPPKKPRFIETLPRRGYRFRGLFVRYGGTQDLPDGTIAHDTSSSTPCIERCSTGVTRRRTRRCARGDVSSIGGHRLRQALHA
jgi:DNA-binding winged helix-turn-helix (wHTH) protein